MTIGICDDEYNVAICLKQIIESLEYDMNCICKVLIYQSGYELLHNLEELDVIFLDIDMPELDGIDIGKRIKELKANCSIIIESGRTDRFKDAFLISAVRFITKPFNQDEIKEALITINNKNIGEKSVNLYYNRNKFSIKQKTIRYIKAYNGYTEYLVEDKLLRNEYSLNEIEKILDSRLFIRVHRQFIVNMKYINKINKRKIEIENIEIEISRRKYMQFQQKFMEYDLRYRGE